MKTAVNSVVSRLWIVVSLIVVAGAQARESDVLPSADYVVARMVQSDVERQTQLAGYTARSHYVAVNKQRRAEMVVGVSCADDGTKQFTIQSEDGSHAIRKHVFYKMLKEESEASHGPTRESARITPANYEFQMTGKEVIEGRPAFVLQVTPKHDDRYLINGTVWVDAADYSIVRIEGRPARNPSFWVHSVHFVRTYRKVGPFWLAASTRTVSQIRFFGESELTIENSDYTLNPSSNRATKPDYEAKLAR
jgi:MucB/RseB N-terminal domain